MAVTNRIKGITKEKMEALKSEFHIGDLVSYNKMNLDGFGNYVQRKGKVIGIYNTYLLLKTEYGYNTTVNFTDMLIKEGE